MQVLISLCFHHNFFIPILSNEIKDIISFCNIWDKELYFFLIKVHYFFTWIFFFFYF